MDKIKQIKELTKELLHHCHLYYDLDAPILSDAAYDKKFDELFKLENETNFWLANSPTRKVQGDVLPYLTTVKHSIPMLSANKSTEIEDVKSFIGDKEVILTFKLDGASIVLKYDNGQLIQGLSRGRHGIEGEDITHTVKMIKNLPMTIPYKEYLEIRGEALIPWRHYNEMNIDDSLGHPRNVASGALRQLSANEASKRNIYFYAFTLVNWGAVGVKTKSDSLQFLKENGFEIVPYQNIHSYELEKTIESFDRTSYENPTDGWCFEYNDLVYGEGLGSTEKHDRKLFALKPELEEHITVFRGVEYRTCRTGIVSLKALFDPVEIGNTTVTKATLHNIDFFNNLELGVGDEISVAKFNEIIPGIVENKTCSGTYKLIDKCPSCGTELIIKNTGTANVLYCSNKSCPSRHLAKFTHFVHKDCADIRGLSEKTLEQLISARFLRTYRDIYHLSDHKNELTLLEGLGEKSVSTLLKSIEKSRDIKLENFLTALGIDGVGKSAAKTISNAFKGDINAVLVAFKTNFDWTTLDDFGTITANSINEYLAKNIDEVYELSKEFNFALQEIEVVAVKNNPFIDKNVAVTGKLVHFTRDSINAKLESLGAKPASGVTAKTHYLINNDSTSSSSKNKKANELNIPIITEEEFLKMCEEKL